MTRSSRVRWLGVLAVASALPVLFSSSPSQGAVVKGKATGIEKLLNPVWEKAKDAAENRYTWREPSPTVRAEFRQLYAHAPKEVCVVALAEAAVPPSTATLALKFAGGRTSPVTLVVAPGTTIEFQNRDPFPHKPYIEGNPSFTPNDMKSAAVRQWKVPGPGKYEVKDHYFPSVRSWIVVEEKAAAVAYPQRDGAFTFSNLAPGKYTLQAFWNGAPQGKALPIDVAAANLDLKDPLLLVEAAAKEPPGKGGAAKEPAGKKEPLAMLASRFWYVLTSLIIGVLGFTLFVGASMYDREAKRSMSEGLGADVQVVTWYLKDDARKRSSSLIQFALDDELVKALAKSSTAYDKVPAEARDKAKKVLATVSAKQPADIAFTSLFAVDQNGRVVAMQGFDQAAGIDDFELGGYPVVADALHGWIRDDSWVLDGRIYRVVARPVEGDTSQPPAGAIVGLRIIDDSFARDLSKRTGAAVAFYANGTSYVSAAPEGFDKAQLDATISDLGSLSADEKYQKSGRSDVRVLRDNLAVVYAKIPGEAYALGAGVAVGRSALLVGNPMGFLKKSDDADKKSVPLPVLIGGSAAIAIFGLLFTLLEYSRPLAVFKREAERLAKGETDQLQPSKFRGTYRKIASDLNDGIERAAMKGGGGTRKAADLDAVLGPLPAQPAMSAFSLPDTSAPAVVLSNMGPSSGPRPLPPRPSEPSTNVEVDALLGGAPSSSGGPRKPPPPRPTAASSATPVPPAPARPGHPVDERAEWQQVYEDFVALKRENGEPTEGFTYEKFQGTLQKHRDAIISKFNCKRVKFSVYTKDGKAALKATPAQDLRP